MDTLKIQTIEMRMKVWENITDNLLKTLPLSVSFYIKENRLNRKFYSFLSAQLL